VKLRSPVPLLMERGNCNVSSRGRVGCSFKYGEFEPIPSQDGTVRKPMWLKTLRSADPYREQGNSLDGDRARCCTVPFDIFDT
jgi:hypothetical protein